MISADIALNVQVASNPHFPLAETEGKNLLKLYLNHVRSLSAFLYGNNMCTILEDVCSIHLGSICETVVASEWQPTGTSCFIMAITPEERWIT